MGSSGYTPQKGEHVIAITAHNGAGLAPLPVAPGPETDMGRRPQGLHALKQVAHRVGVDLRGASLHRAGGFEAPRHRQMSFNAGMLPNIPEHPRQRQHTKRGRQRLCNAAIHTLRMRVERTLAWEDTCKRRRLRLARLPQRHYGMQLLAYTLINLRAFCGV